MSKYYESPEIMIGSGDVLVAQRGSCGKVAFIDEEIGPATINPSMVVLKNLRINGAFLGYWLLGDFVQGTFKMYISATAVPMISQQQIGNIPICIPPSDEQKTIVQYLIQKTAKIDQLITKIEAAIDRLQEYHTALITAAVTGKIDVRPEAGECSRTNTDNHGRTGNETDGHGQLEITGGGHG